MSDQPTMSMTRMQLESELGQVIGKEVRFLIMPSKLTVSGKLIKFQHGIAVVEELVREEIPGQIIDEDHTLGSNLEFKKVTVRRIVNLSDVQLIEATVAEEICRSQFRKGGRD